MNHLAFILAAYGIFLVITLAFVIDATLRVRRARRLLAAIDTRRPR